VWRGYGAMALSLTPMPYLTRAYLISKRFKSAHCPSYPQKPTTSIRRRQKRREADSMDSTRRRALKMPYLGLWHFRDPKGDELIDSTQRHDCRWNSGTGSYDIVSFGEAHYNRGK